MQVHQVPADHGPDGPPHHHAPCDGQTLGCTVRRSLQALPAFRAAGCRPRLRGGHCDGTGRALFVGAEEVLLGGFLPLAVGLDRCAAVGGVTQWLTSVFHAKILDNRLSHFDREFLLSGRTCSVERSTIDATSKPTDC